MKKRNVLVTGAAGFIGSHLVDSLLGEGCWAVTAVDNFNDFYPPTDKWWNIEKHFDYASYRLVKADVCNRGALINVFNRTNFDAVVHLAALAGVRPSLKYPELYAETNVGGTLNLLELARQFGVKQFVFASSSSVYGINADVPFAEEDKISQPISTYAATKAAGELLCHTYAHLYDIRAVCLRFFTVYGARQRPDLAIHKFARLISSGLPISVYGDGATRRDYTYIDDIISGVRAAIDFTAADYEIINLGESRTVELYELIKILEGELKRTAIINTLPVQAGDVPQTYADIQKARRLLGYSPKIGIEEGIRRFVEWFNRKPSFANQTATSRAKVLIYKKQPTDPIPNGSIH